MADSMDQTLVSTEDPDRAPPERLVLICVGSAERHFEHAGAVYPLTGVHHVEFGRADDDAYRAEHRREALQLSIPLPWVSGRHADLYVEGHRMRVVDRGSRNGTRVEGQPVDGTAAITLGQVLEVGRSFWTLRTIRSSSPGLSEPDPGEDPPWTSDMANPDMRKLHRDLRRLAPSNVPILITGETGTGKEQLARSLHERSGRTGPFLAVSLAGGSVSRLRPEAGLLEQARGGTLYLDDVGELTPEGQIKLTSTLMSHAPSDWQLEHPPQGELRLVASSTRDLRAMVGAGTFRPDLLARLAGFEVLLPPLRARREDLGPLLLETLATVPGGSSRRLTTDVFRAMLTHPWPFNLRELHHSVGTAARLVEPGSQSIDLAVWNQACWTVEGGDPTPGRVEAVRRELVQQMARHRGELQAVATALQCEVEEIRRWTERFSLQPERYRDAG